MTDQRARAVERAEQVIRDVHKDLPDIWLGGRQRYVLAEAIATALADERRRGMEDMLSHLSELAKALPVQHEQPNLGQCTYNWYRHVEKLLREYAKAHAGQEG